MTDTLPDLLAKLEKEVCEFMTYPRDVVKAQPLWSVQIFPADTGVCLGRGDTLLEAGTMALRELAVKRLRKNFSNALFW